MIIKNLYTLGVACFAAVYGCSSSTAAILTDDFNDGTLNSSLWAVSEFGGPTITEKDGKAHCVMPSSSHGLGYNHISPFGVVDPPNIFASYYVTQHSFAGNFDVVIDYSLLKWPQASGTRVSLFMDSGGLNTGAQRVSLSAADNWTSYAGADTYIFGGSLGLSGIVETLDSGGGLRLTRENDMVSGYYRNSQDGSWVMIGQFQTPSLDSHLGFAIFNTDELFSQQDVEVAFDNFNLNYDGTLNAVPEPTTWIAGVGSLAMFLWRMKRRK